MPRGTNEAHPNQPILAWRPVTHPAQEGCAPSLPRFATTRRFREDVADLGVGRKQCTGAATKTRLI